MGASLCDSLGGLLIVVHGKLSEDLRYKVKMSTQLTKSNSRKVPG
jgi:hypothetical protein